MPGTHLLILNAAEGVLQLLVAAQAPRQQDTPLHGENTPTAFSLLAAESFAVPSQGAELLTPALDFTLRALHLSPHEIGSIAVVRGPGSFTGLRLAIATAAGFCRATGALAAGLDYLPLLAASAAHKLFPALQAARPADAAAGAFARQGAFFGVTTHARRNLVHMQVFYIQDATSAPAPASEILVFSPDEAFAAFLAAVSQHTTETSPAQGAKANTQHVPMFLLGSGLDKNRSRFETLADEVKRGTPLSLLPADFSHPAQEALLMAATTAEFGTGDVAPLYVRPPDAVDNLPGIAASLGLRPEEAFLRLRELTGE